MPEPGRPPIKLSVSQERKLVRVAQKGEQLAQAKREVERTTEALKKAALDAVDAGVPVQRVADAAGVHRPTVYEWKEGK
jgi:hypothetical protein